MVKKVNDAWRESTTFKLVFTSWLLVTTRFMVGGISLDWIAIPVMSATEYSTAVAAILIIWLGREWRSAHYASKT